ncbi:MAG: WG repeat-containing protein [Flavobacteriales bacterium]|nr:WG repeat-containing protein [Flavobacteriales bacterium]
MLFVNNYYIRAINQKKISMKALFTLILGLAITGNCFSQNILAQAKPAGQDNWGYIDPSGKFVIEASYAKCHPFTKDGFAPIYEKKRKSFYFIDTKGKELATDLKTFKLKNYMGFGTLGFQEGLAMVQVGKNWGYLNTAGKLVIDAKYEKAHPFVDGHAAVKSGGTWVILDKEGKETAIDLKGALDVRKFSEGLAPIQSADKLLGFVNAEGKVVIEAQFKAVGYFVDGLGYAKTSDGLVGYINQKGDWVIEAQFAKAGNFSKGDGFAKATQGETKGFVSKDGKFHTLTDADSFGNFHEGLAYGKKGGLVGFFNTKGTWVIKPTFQAVKKFKNGYARAKQNDKWGFIDRTGKWAIEARFDGVKDFEKVN